MPFQKGAPGRPKGAKDKHPRAAKAAIRLLLDEFGNDTARIAQVINRGLDARPPASFPYLKLVIEQNTGAPDQRIDLVTKVVHEHR